MTTRRQFVHQTAALSAGALLGASLQGAGDAPLPIVDTHQHLWDLKKFKLPWIEKGSPLQRNYLMSDYLQEARGLNIVKTLYMEVDVDPSQQQAEAEYVIELCKRADTPMVGAIISGRPAEARFARYIRQFRDSAYIKGVRQVLHGTAPKGFCLKKEFLAGIRLLGELGMSFDLCMRPTELLDAAQLADACPDTQFILDHCGNGPVQGEHTQWQRDMTAIAKRKNVVCKVSGIVAGAKPKTWIPEDLAPLLTHTLQVFGPDRVLFGGDWPVCTKTATLRAWVEALKVVVKDRPRDEQHKLFYDNAVRYYRLS